MIRSFILLALSFTYGFIFSQDCNLTLTGVVLDRSTNAPLSYSHVVLDNDKGVTTDSEGNFVLKEVCQGHRHILFSHLGCASKNIHIDMFNDTSIIVYLNHYEELLDEVIIDNETKNSSTQQKSTVSRSEISREGNKGIADILQNLTGVSTISTGSEISKPVIHGLYGNRVSFINNGIVHTGQQWGNDHAPEIDPNTADHISVVKGAAAIQYSGNSLGGVVLVEPGEITDDRHLHGNVNYIFQSNGFGHSLNTRLEKNSGWLAWRATASVKIKGDSRAPGYYLTNTGKKEANLSLQLQKSFSDRWTSEIFYSLFSTEIGILRGSHIGNLTDLENALSSEIPFFTNEKFSYKINEPRQTVQHHFLKASSRYKFGDEEYINIKYGFQSNARKEYDVRRGGRSDIPSLNMKQYSNYLETVYNKNWQNGFSVRSGLQFVSIDNANIAGTGILPLIPKYISYNPSLFLINSYEREKILLELGGRYDYQNLRVSDISDSIPRVINRIGQEFHTYSVTSGIRYNIIRNLKINLNAGLMTRAPGINEMYSDGLHQGVSGIEEGQKDLKTEKGYKTVLSADWNLNNKLFLQALAYYQRIDNYIFLEPQEEFRLTIRGAFPLFIYKQTDARISGTDWLLTYAPLQSLKFTAKYSLVRGKDLDSGLTLINLPSDNLSASVKYSYHSGKIMRNNYIKASFDYVWQNRIDPSQDFLPPPEDYYLLGLAAGTTFSIGSSFCEVEIEASNLLNEEYREYLNRLRYFANETGIDIVLRLNFIF